MKNEKKSVQNIKYILNKNRDNIKQIVASVSFITLLNTYPDIIYLNITENEETGDTLEIEAIPTVVSQTITKNAIIEMKNGESIIFSLEE